MARSATPPPPRRGHLLRSQAHPPGSSCCSRSPGRSKATRPNGPRPPGCPAQIFIDAAAGTWRTPAAHLCGGPVLLGMASVTANSRMSYAFSRDGACRVADLEEGQPTHGYPDELDLAVRDLLGDPGAAVVVEHHRVPGGHLDRGHRPVHRVRRAGLPALRDPTSGRPGTSAGTARSSAGPRSSGCSIICVLFVLPTASPITAVTFNYTIIAVGVVAIAVTLWWMLSAKNWFTGPRHNVDLGALERRRSVPRRSPGRARPVRSRATGPPEDGGTVDAGRDPGRAGARAGRRAGHADVAARYGAGTRSRSPSPGWPRRSGWVLSHRGAAAAGTGPGRAASRRAG